MSDYLKQRESSVWEWYASNPVRREQAESVRMDLLKATYRISRETSVQLYQIADDVTQQLGLSETPLTLYQAQDPSGLNASLAYVPDESHIVLHGPIADRLCEPELRALLAHELGHMLLYRFRDGELLIVDQILAAMTHDRDADTPQITSARLFALYTEVFCDRVALSIADNADTVVSMLVQLSTGIAEVEPASYLVQANEILGEGPFRSSGLSHPEDFVRARGLQLWEQLGAEAIVPITDLIEGPLVLSDLDLLAQHRLMELTRCLFDHLLAPRWIQSEVVLAHARLFFDDYERPLSMPTVDRLEHEIQSCDLETRRYFCYVMLDFVTADRELEDAPLANAIGVAASLGLSEPFAEIAIKELRLRKRQFEKIVAESSELVASAARLEATT